MGRGRGRGPRAQLFYHKRDAGWASPAVATGTGFLSPPFDGAGLGVGPAPGVEVEEEQEEAKALTRWL